MPRRPRHNLSMFPTSSSTNTDLRAGVFTPPVGPGVRAFSRPEGTPADHVATNGAGWRTTFVASGYFAKNVSARGACDKTLVAISGTISAVPTGTRSFSFSRRGKRVECVKSITCHLE